MNPFKKYNTRANRKRLDALRAEYASMPVVKPYHSSKSYEIFLIELKELVVMMTNRPASKEDVRLMEMGFHRGLSLLEVLTDLCWTRRKKK